MAPINQNKTQCNDFKIPNKTIKRRQRKRDKFCLKSASNIIKFVCDSIATKTNCLRTIQDKFAIKWNIFAKPSDNYSSSLFDSKITQFAANAKEIYEKLMRSCDGVKGDCNANYFIEKNASDSARHYASYLWNWNEQNEARKNKKWSLYFKNFMHVTVKHMNHYDFDIVRNIIAQFYSDAFPDISATTDDAYIKDTFASKIAEHKHTAFVIADVIHSWFLISPVLEELSKYIGWDFLKEINAFILDVDTLYSVLVAIIYKKQDDSKATLPKTNITIFKN